MSATYTRVCAHTFTHAHSRINTHPGRQTDKGKWMLLFPQEGPGNLLFPSHADRAGGNRVVGVRCWADEARLSPGVAHAPPTAGRTEKGSERGKERERRCEQKWP